MQETLLEEILVYGNKRDSRRTIDQYLTKTIALFTPEPPEPFMPVFGPWAPSELTQRDSYFHKEIEQGRISMPEPKPIEPLGLSVSKGATKFFGPESDIPIMRLDRKPHHGLPDNHLQFGRSDYTGRNGNEAYDIYVQIFKETKRPIIFPFDEKKKEPWEY